MFKIWITKAWPPRHVPQWLRTSNNFHWNEKFCNSRSITLHPL